MGNHFTLHSDHNPLTRLRESKNAHRKISRWLSELEEYNYTIQYICGALNNKADALSRQAGASQFQPPSTFEDRVYALFTDGIHFKSQLLDAQSTDLLLSDAVKHINQKIPISTGRLKQVQSQLRLQDGVLTKSGRPVLPASLRSIVVQEYHNIVHLGIDKTYNTIWDRFYWPNMFNYIKSFITRCEPANVPNVILDLQKHHLRICLYPMLQCSLFQSMLDIYLKTIMDISTFYLLVISFPNLYKSYL